jgi:RHS repeat-associated protein
MEINCGVLAEVKNYLLFNGINMSDSVIAKTYLNHYFKRNLSYAAYQSVNQLCQTNQGSFVLMQPGVEYEELRGYRFGFNGKEKDYNFNPEVDNNTLDYVDRVVDIRLGRWFSVDPFYTLALGFSPYGFVYNNPIRNVDYKGLFVIAANDPNASLLRSYIEAAKSLLADPYVYEIFKKHSGLTDEQITDIFTDGKGPQLTIESLDEEGKLVAEYQPTNAIPITYKAFEYSEINPQSIIGQDKIVLNKFYFLKFKELSSMNRKNPHNFYIAVVLLHELVHFGDLRNDGVKNNNVDFNKEFPDPNDLLALQNITVNSGYKPKDIASFQQGIEPGKAFEFKLTGGIDLNRVNIKPAFKNYSKESKLRKPKSNHPLYSPRYL